MVVVVVVVLRLLEPLEGVPVSVACPLALEPVADKLFKLPLKEEERVELRTAEVLAVLVTSGVEVVVGVSLVLVFSLVVVVSGVQVGVGSGVQVEVGAGFLVVVGVLSPPPEPHSQVISNRPSPTSVKYSKRP